MKLQPRIQSFLHPQPCIHSSYIHSSYIHSPKSMASVVFSTFGIPLSSGAICPLTATHMTVWQVELLFTGLLKQNTVGLVDIAFVWWNSPECFSKKLSEQKVPLWKVVGLYETYKKYEKIGGPNSYQNREKWTSVFYQKKISKSLSIFSPKNRVF